MRNRLTQFMMGRYGADGLNRTLSVMCLILFLLSCFRPLRILYWLAIALFLWMTFRTLSRNISARYKENEWFLEKTATVRRLFGRTKYRMEQRRYYHLYKCPTCRQVVRVPKGKGKISITCPKCRTEFIRRS